MADMGDQWEGPEYVPVGKKVNPLLHPHQFKAQRRDIWDAQNRGRAAVYSDDNNIAGKPAAPLMKSAIPQNGQVWSTMRMPNRLVDGPANSRWPIIDRIADSRLGDWLSGKD